MAVTQDELKNRATSTLGLTAPVVKGPMTVEDVRAGGGMRFDTSGPGFTIPTAAAAAPPSAGTAIPAATAVAAPPAPVGVRTGPDAGTLRAMKDNLPGNINTPLPPDPFGGKTAAEFAKGGGVFTNAQLKGNTAGGASAVPSGIEAPASRVVPRGVELPALPYEDARDRNNREVGERNARIAGDYDRNKFIADITWRAQHAAMNNDKQGVRNLVEMLSSVLPEMDKTAEIGLAREGMARAEQDKLYGRGIEQGKVISDAMDKSRGYGLDVAKFEAGKPLTEAQAEAAKAHAGLYNAQAKTAGQSKKDYLHEAYLKQIDEYAKALSDPLADPESKISAQERISNLERLIEEREMSRGNGGGAAPYKDGTRLKGKDGKMYVVKGGQPVLEG